MINGNNLAGGVPPQEQDVQPGQELPMQPPPRDMMEDYRGAAKLRDRVALVTGGDSGIGRAVSVAFAKEGAHVVIAYLDEHEDAQATLAEVEEQGVRGLLRAGDIGDEGFCRKLVDDTIEHFGRLDILVNNAGEQHLQPSLTDITTDQLERTFRTNIFGMFHLTRFALPHLKEGACVINTTSVTAYRGSAHLIDYAASKGAIVSFTRSLSAALAKQGIRVNAVAPGPIWTPLIPATFDKDEVASFGTDEPLGRPGQPEEVAPSYVFLASADSSYMTGQVLHPNGGEIVNG